VDDPYEHPYPSAETAAQYPFSPLDFRRFDLAEMRSRGEEFRAEMDRRRSVRMISPEPVPLDLIETAIVTASTAPSGAHRQPWQFVVTGDPDVKRQIRDAAEEEERTNYEGGRINDERRDALARWGTDWHKEFLTAAPWVVVLFEQRFGVTNDGSRQHNYYVKESVGIAAGMFITALHRAGLVTLTHTPSPMAFLSRLLERPENERPFVLFPVGFPMPGAQVPVLRRKSLDEVRTIVGKTPSPPNEIR
jgi:nitroreductase